jgi:predicted DNA-binding WGR domain protein
MKRTFEYTDDKSNKFWSIETNGDEFTVTFGKIGTDGQSQTKSFADEEACNKAAEKLINEKTKKGYEEVSGGDDEDDDDSDGEVLTEMLNSGEKKYYTEYDSGAGVSDIAKYILNDPDLPKLKSIIIGMWDEEIYDVDPDEIFTMIIKNKEKFQHIESLFVGDMESEENEISWIVQGTYDKLLESLPNLKSLTIQGSTGLVLGKINHPKLEELEIICGGLPASVVNDIKAAKLPALKKLVLYLGVDDYGYDCEVSDFADLAKKSLFPNLTHLGFTDSEEQDEMVRVILESDLLPQLEVIEISCGCLTDKGGQLILDAASKLGNLKKLDASFNYLSEGMMKSLKALPFEVDVSDSQGEPDPDDEYSTYPMITE